MAHTEKFTEKSGVNWWVSLGYTCLTGMWTWDQWLLYTLVTHLSFSCALSGGQLLVWVEPWCGSGMRSDPRTADMSVREKGMYWWRQLNPSLREVAQQARLCSLPERGLLHLAIGTFRLLYMALLHVCLFMCICVTCSAEMNDSFPNKNRGYIYSELPLTREPAIVLCLTETARGWCRVRKLPSDRRGALSLDSMEKAAELTEDETHLVIGLGRIFGFLWLVLSWKYR